MPVRDLGRDDKWFQENMGNGGMSISLPKRESSKNGTSAKQSDQSSAPTQSAPQEWQDQVAVEAWESMHNKVMTPEIAAELGLSITPTKKD